MQKKMETIRWVVALQHSSIQSVALLLIIAEAASKDRSPRSRANNVFLTLAILEAFVLDSGLQSARSLCLWRWRIEKWTRRGNRLQWLSIANSCLCEMTKFDSVDHKWIFERNDRIVAFIHQTDCNLYIFILIRILQYCSFFKDHSSQPYWVRSLGISSRLFASIDAVVVSTLLMIMHRNTLKGNFINQP